jgi:hypothetical protein
MIFTRAWPAVAVTGVVTLVMVHMCFNTYYTISGNWLLVKNSFVINKKIDIGSIKKIVPIKNMLSAPALSMDRLEIFYNQDNSVLVSPEDKAGFIEHLKGINGEIV